MVTNAGGGSTSAEAANTPEVWRDMERRLERAGQLHVLMPTPPPERRAAFLTQLSSLDLEGLPKLLATSLENAQTVADKQVEPFKAERLAVSNAGGTATAEGFAAPLTNHSRVWASRCAQAARISCSWRSAGPSAASS